MTKPGARWAEFADEAGELGRDIAGLIERHRFALIGTIRRDGMPRISAVETHLVSGHLMLVMIPRTRKASDIRRDDRRRFARDRGSQRLESGEVVVIPVRARR